MPVDVNKYTQDLMEAAGLTDAEQKKQLEAIFGNPKVRERLTNTLSDVEAMKGRYETEKTAREKAVAEAQRVYEENLRIFNNNKTVMDEAMKQVAAYEDRYGKLDDATRAAAVREAADAIDKKTFEEEMKKRDGLTIGLVVAASKITARHLKQFNEEPDFDAIQKIAIEQGLNAEKAYEAWVQPKMAERSKTEQEAALKVAREEGFREGASKRAAGTLTDAEPKSPFMENLRKSKEGASTARESFLSGWREPVGAGK